MSTLVKFEPAFVEEAVFLTVKSLEERGDEKLTRSFNTQRELLYEKKADEKAFREFYANYFKQFGLNSVFENIFSEHPLLDHSRAMIFVRRVFSRKYEGSELYVDGNLKTVLLSIRSERLVYPEPLAKFLRHELLRVSDMLDPVFEYSPEAPLGGVNDAENNLIRERFSALWDYYIGSRLGDRSFSESKRFTQKELIAMARDERALKSLKDSCLLCVLCGFPSFDRVEDWGGAEKLRVAKMIQKDRPDWDPSMDSCRQCFEMYQAQEAALDGKR